LREERIRIRTQDVELEGLWTPGSLERGVVVAHPHPLYGGSMDNNVVAALASGFQSAGLSTLLFNFRGVGSSTGSYDYGKGERRDLEAACRFLSARGVGRKVLCGYSFGAWIAAASLEDIQPEGLVLVSPPLSVWDFLEVANTDVPVWVIGGDRDSFCPLPKLESLLQGISSLQGSRVFTGADHFYAGCELELQDVVEKWFR